MNKLTDTQTVILNKASQRDGLLALPLPDNLRGAAAAKVVRAMLAEGGSDESQLKPVRNFSLKRLVPMSKGQFSEEKIAELIAAAEAYDPATAPAPEGATSAQATQASALCAAACRGCLWFKV